MFFDKKTFLFVIVIAILSSGGCRSHEPNVTNSPNFKDGKFVNTTPRGEQRSTYKLIKFLFFEERGYWPEWIENKFNPDLTKKTDKNTITFINHAAFLANVDGRILLFDPIFSKNAGPNEWFGVERRRPPAVSIDKIPHVDYIFISHNHYDHLDLPSLKYLVERDQPLVFVPLGDKMWLTEEGVNNIIELDWWQEHKINSCFKVVFVPAQHSSSRTPFDLDQSLWGGYVVETPTMTIFHAGDTGYSDHFKKIGDKFDIDVAMLPIGDYEPKWFLEYVHMDPKQALQAHRDLKSKQSFGMHSETFPLTVLGYYEAENTFNKLYENDSFEYPFTLLEVGESLSFSDKKICEKN